jgi:TPR repeat protein
MEHSMPSEDTLSTQNETPNLSEQKQNPSDEKKIFLKAYELLDHLTEQKDLDEVITQLKNCHIFNAYYLLGELYRYGINKVVNNNPISLLADKSLASEYFLKAYELNKNIKILISQTESIPPISYDTMTVTHLHDLTEIAEKGHAVALYQLGVFFESEFKLEKRKTSLMPLQLKQFEKSCFTAAANLYHPHAASKIAAQTEDQTEKMRYSIIAADPVFARYTLRENIQFIELRGSKDVPSLIELDPPNNVLPSALQSKRAISFAKMGGVFSSSVQHQSSKSILPSTYYASSEAHQLSEGGQALSKEEVRKLRASKFCLK